MKKAARFVSLSAISSLFSITVITFITPCLAADYYPTSRSIVSQYKVSLNFMGKSTVIKMVKTNLEEKKLGDNIVIPERFESKKKNAYQYIVKDEKGVLIYAKQEVGNKEISRLNPPEYVLRYPLKVGTSWEFGYNTEFIVVKTNVPMTCSIEKIDDVITVPAGKFEKCIKIKCAGLSIQNFNSLSWGVRTENYDWFAPDVGLVKSIMQERCSDPKMGYGDIMIELESFKGK